MELLIYLIGFILTYYLTRKFFRKELKEKYSWSNVFIAILFSSISFIGLFIIAIIYLSDTKPPKFL